MNSLSDVANYGPLAGYKVLEMGANISVPYATMLLGDQGAEIIKLEAAGGDQTRVAGNTKVGVDGMATLFLGCNRNKRSIVLDLKNPEDIAAARQIAASCDVVIQNFRPGVVDRLGIGYEAIRAIRPDIIYVSVDGLGSVGKGATRRVYDIVVQGLAGYAAMQGGIRPGATPTLIYSSITDKIAAMNAWQAVTAALLVRERTGKGQHITISMLEAAIAFLWPDVMTKGALSGEDVKQGVTPASVRCLFPTKDGHIVVGMFSNPEWAALCRAIERADLIGDPRFPSLSERLMNAEEMNGILVDIFATRTTAAWVERLEAEDAVFAPVNHPDGVMDDPNVIALGTIVELNHPLVGAYRQAQHPIRFGETPASIRRHAPALGADTDAVLGEFGITPR